jgi:hypothetical protein
VLDFDVQRCTRRCAASDRELKPGETFYSVLVTEGADVVRYDYAEDAWPGAPAGALGWWKSQMPDPQANRLHWAPNDVMLDYFEQLANEPEKEDTRYVLALLMLRRRVVRLEETKTDDRGREILSLYCPKKETEYEVAVTDPDAERIGQIQDELARLLFAKAS